MNGFCMAVNTLLEIDRSTEDNPRFLRELQKGDAYFAFEVCQIGETRPSPNPDSRR